VSFLAILAATSVAGALLFHNVWGYTRFAVGGLSADRPYDHGWPFTYLVRNEWITTPTGTALNQIPWAWVNVPGMIRKFSLPLLICNAVVALTITAATYFAVAYFVRRFTTKRQYSLRTLFLVVLLAALVAGLCRLPFAAEWFIHLLVPAIIWCGVACTLFQSCRLVFARWPRR